jgi:starch synthase
VIGALCSALAGLGLEVTLVLPFYRQIERTRYAFTPTGREVSVLSGADQQRAEIWRDDSQRSFSVYLLKCDRYYDREGIYGNDRGDYPDNGARFFFFSRAVLETARAIGFAPDLIHCHDWHTGLIPAYLSSIYRNVPFFGRTATLFSIHNLGYQGLFSRKDWPLTGLPESLFTPRGVEFYGKINCMKAGILYSDLVSTVSRSYAREIQTPEFGFGLEGVIKQRAHRLHGVLNGIDIDEWDPSKDPYIAHPYEASALSGKSVCKRALQKELGLPVDPDIPLLCSISRLVDQKGVDLIAACFDDLMKTGVQYVMLGSGEKRYETLFADLAAGYFRQTYFRMAYDGPFSHRIEAGADILLMPSRYEPCGLSQLIGLRYGTVPLVRATGGLDDTVKPFRIRSRSGNGFKFREYDARAFLKKIGEAIALYPRKSIWHALMRNGMSEDFSWDAPARKYLRLYRLARTLSKNSGDRAR